MNRREIAQHWQQSGGDNPLKIDGVTYDTFQDAFNNRPFDQDGLNTGPVDLVCIDEGLRPAKDKSGRSRDTVRIGGSGILSPVDTIMLSGAPIQRVFSHEDCGAAEKYKELQSLNAEPDDIAKIEAEKLATRLGAIYAGPSKLHRPRGLHVARAVYVDATRTGYETSEISTLPKGFGISRGVFGHEAGSQNAALAARIAQESSGFGELYAPETPLHVVGIYDSRDGFIDREQLQEEIDTLKSPNVQTNIIDIAQRKSSRTVVDLGAK